MNSIPQALRECFERNLRYLEEPPAFVQHADMLYAKAHGTLTPYEQAVQRARIAAFDRTVEQASRLLGTRDLNRLAAAVRRAGIHVPPASH